MHGVPSQTKATEDNQDAGAKQNPGVVAASHLLARGIISLLSQYQRREPNLKHGNVKLMPHSDAGVWCCRAGQASSAVNLFQPCVDAL